MTRFTWLPRLVCALALLGGLTLAAMGPRSAAAAYSPYVWLTDWQGPSRCAGAGADCQVLAMYVPHVQVNGEGFAVGSEVGIGYYFPGEAVPFLEERTTAATHDGYLDGSFGKGSPLAHCDNGHGQTIEIQVYDFTNQVWSNSVPTKVCLDGAAAETVPPPADESASALDPGVLKVGQVTDPYATDLNDVAVNALAGTGQVNIHAYRCDDDHNEIFNQLIAECTPIGGQNFTLTDSAKSYSAYSTPDQPINWSGIATGSMSLRGQLNTEWETPVVLCEGAGPNGGHNLASLTVNGDTISTTLNADEVLDCFWFNMVIGARESAETGSVTITKYICPEGFDAETASLDDLRTVCGEPMNGILFELNHAFNEYPDLLTEAPQTTGSLAPGLVSWETLPGDLTIAEQIPSGYDEPVVSCESWLPDFGFTGSNPATVEGDRISHELIAGEDLSCEWYNVPASEWDYDDEGENSQDDSGGEADSVDDGISVESEGNESAADSDGDGISDEDELHAFGTDPYLTDSDDDGLSDDEEISFLGTDPLNNDTDGDQLVDGDEVNLIWTDPFSFDTDGDGVNDGTEAYSNGTDPLDSASY